MEMLQKRLRLNIFVSVVVVILFIYFVALEDYFLIFTALGAGIICLGFLVQDIRNLKAARLITENCMINVCPAMVCKEKKKGEQGMWIVKCVLSPFGLLVGSRVYKFGHEGVRLNAIEIGIGKISVNFGTEKKRWTVVLLHEILNEDELAMLIKTVIYETGVIPNLPDTDRMT